MSKEILSSEAVRAHRRRVGHQLRIAREALGKKGKDWMAEYGILESNQSNMMDGLSYPPPLFLAVLCDDTGLTLDFFNRGVMAGVAQGLTEPLRRVRSELSAAAEANPDGRKRSRKSESARTSSIPADRGS